MVLTYKALYDLVPIDSISRTAYTKLNWPDLEGHLDRNSLYSPLSGRGIKLDGAHRRSNAELWKQPSIGNWTSPLHNWI